MLIVWMWAVPSAAFIARHYKHSWSEVTVLGQRPWFQLHRTVTLLAVILSCVAFILPFLYRRGWSQEAGSHPHMGCAVMSLSIIQLIMAALRPASESSRRVVFRRLHSGVGAAVQILSSACVFLGIVHQMLPLSPSVLTSWLLWILLSELLLLVLRRTGRSRGDNTEDLVSPQVDKRQCAQTPGVMMTMLLVTFIVGNSVFLAASLQIVAAV
ncbi:hypothetical protein INR49_006977 [Caranx melampygus]|nr:hypothetical protein INR49_006977 [Caranx melampygus]